MSGSLVGSWDLGGEEGAEWAAKSIEESNWERGSPSLQFFHQDFHQIGGHCVDDQAMMIMTILPNFLNGANLASRGAREVSKKGKSSEFNPRNYEQVESSQSLAVWWLESVKDALRLDKRVKLRVSKKMVFLERSG